MLKNKTPKMVASLFAICGLAAGSFAIRVARGTEVTPDSFGWYCAADGGCNSTAVNECINLEPGENRQCDWCDGPGSSAMCCPSPNMYDSCDDTPEGGSGNIISGTPDCGQNWHGTCQGDNCNNITPGDDCNLTFCSQGWID